MATEKSEAQKTLETMFETVDPGVIEAVLEANNGALEPSLNALLEISDPNFKGEESVMPIQAESGLLTSTSQQQLLNDEELARSLAAAEAGRLAAPVHRAPQIPPRPQQQQQQNEFSFSEELPVIKEKIMNAADTTKKKIKEWYDRFKQTDTDHNPEYASNPQYTNLPYDESDNVVLNDDFHQNSHPTQPTQKREPIKIIRQNNNNNSNNNDNSSNSNNNNKTSDISNNQQDSVLDPYIISANKSSEIPPRQSNLTRASSEDAEEIKKIEFK